MLKNLKKNAYEFIKYVIASGIALIVDYLMYLFLINQELAPSVAGAIGYTSGLAIAYILYTKKVFTKGWLRSKKKYEITLFAISGAIGLTITYFTIKIYVDSSGADVAIKAKIIAIFISFISVYLFRKIVVFKT